MLGAAALLLILSNPIAAQTPPGVSPATTAIPVEFGYIDAASGNLHLEFPIASLTQRASNPFSATIVYDSQMWHVNSGVWTASSGAAIIPINNSSGWHLVTTNDSGFITYTATHKTCTSGGQTYPYTVYSNFMWIASDGSSKAFATGTTTLNLNSSHCGPQSVSTTSGSAKDASGFHIYVTNYYGGKILRPDGTVWGNKNEVPPLTGFNTNGNNYSTTGPNFTIVDTLGRNPITITSSCNGNANQVCYDVPNSQGGTSHTTVTTETISVSTNFQQQGTTECSPCTITVLQSIALPDGTSYTFNYDSGTTPGNYGELTGVTLPTGGQIAYAYTTFQGACTSDGENRWINSRTEGPGTWLYTPQVVTSSTCAINSNVGQQQMTVSTPSNDSVVYTLIRDYRVNGVFGGAPPRLSQIQTYGGSVSPGNLLSTITLT